MGRGMDTLAANSMKPSRHVRYVVPEGTLPGSIVCLRVADTQRLSWCPWPSSERPGVHVCAGVVQHQYPVPVQCASVACGWVLVRPGRPLDRLGSAECWLQPHSAGLDAFVCAGKALAYAA